MSLVSFKKIIRAGVFAILIVPAGLYASDPLRDLMKEPLIQRQRDLEIILDGAKGVVSEHLGEAIRLESPQKRDELMRQAVTDAKIRRCKFWRSELKEEIERKVLLRDKKLRLLKAGDEARNQELGFHVGSLVTLGIGLGGMFAGIALLIAQLAVPGAIAFLVGALVGAVAIVLNGAQSWARDEFESIGDEIDRVREQQADNLDGIEQMQEGMSHCYIKHGPELDKEDPEDRGRSFGLYL